MTSGRIVVRWCVWRAKEESVCRSVMGPRRLSIRQRRPNNSTRASIHLGPHHARLVGEILLESLYTRGASLAAAPRGPQVNLESLSNGRAVGHANWVSESSKSVSHALSGWQHRRDRFHTYTGPSCWYITEKKGMNIFFSSFFKYV